MQQKKKEENVLVRDPEYENWAAPSEKNNTNKITWLKVHFMDKGSGLQVYDIMAIIIKHDNKLICMDTHCCSQRQMITILGDL